MADLEFFFDPICPWAWITSRWVDEVAKLRTYDVEWKFICLRMVNEDRAVERGKTYEPYPGHLSGQKMLRVAAAIRDAAGNDAVGRYYTELGTRIHNGGRNQEVRDGNLAIIDETLAACGLDASLSAEQDNDAHDAALRAETDLCLSRTGKDVGTPIITFAPATEREASFFGPVIDNIPRGDEALKLWDAVETIARVPGLAELKRSLRGRPSFD
ncbi:MAG: hypothetical protein AB7L13_20110 [Acidimicrobiia bacterium]